MTNGPAVANLPRGAGRPSELSALKDDQLLSRFFLEREDAAFGVLVERYGPLVYGVCRRILADSNDAEDAFQATFLVLVRKGGALRDPGRLASWLYGVAYRVSARLRREAARMKRQPFDETMATHSDPLDELLARHEEAITDEEVAALPESLHATTVAAGCSSAISLARLGPVTTATRDGSAPVTWTTIWLIRIKVSSSMPLARLTRVTSSVIRGAHCARLARIVCDGTASSTVHAPDSASAGSPVARIDFGRSTSPR